MSWRTVYIKDSEKIRLKLDNIEIWKNGDKIYVPLSDIETIILEGQDTIISTRLLAKLSKNHILLIVCDQKYLPTGMYLEYGQYHRCAKRIHEQLKWDDELKRTAWENIINQKITNQIKLAKYLGADIDRLELMDSLSKEIKPMDSSNREGHIAKVYFNTIYGQGFSRNVECIENMAMNFGYTIIRSFIARCVVANGLITAEGLFHTNEYNQFNLVDDLMEPFRPIVDFWINTKIIDKKIDHLTYEKRLKIIDIINQPMLSNNHEKSTLDQIIKKYINNFIESMNSGNVQDLYQINIDNFILVNEA